MIQEWVERWGDRVREEEKDGCEHENLCKMTEGEEAVVSGEEEEKMRSRAKSEG